MKYLIQISQLRPPPKGWVKIHEAMVTVPMAEVAASLIEKAIKEAGLSIDGRDLRDILKEELEEP